MAFKPEFSQRRTRLIFSIFTITSALVLTSIGVVFAAEVSGTKGPIGLTGRSNEGVSGPVSGSSITKLKSDIIVINAPVKKVVGESGPQGIQGLSGPQGIQGEQGPEGEEGMVGPQGPEGLQGNQGNQGIQGIQGIQGPVGSQGPKGDKGDTGPQGPAGQSGSDGVTKTISITSGSAGSSLSSFSLTFGSGISTGSAASLAYVDSTQEWSLVLPDLATLNSCADGRNGGTKVIALTMVGGHIGVTCGADNDSGVSAGSGVSIGPLDSVTNKTCTAGQFINSLSVGSRVLTTSCAAPAGLQGELLPPTQTNGAKTCDPGKVVDGISFTSPQLTYHCVSVSGNGDEGSTSLPNFSFSGSSAVSITSGSSASVIYNGTKFSIVIPSGILGSTVTLDSRNDSCGDTEKVSSLTLTSDKVLSVNCSPDQTAPISQVSASATSAGSNPTVTWSSSNKKLSFVIPSGAPGIPGLTGSPGPQGDNGRDGTDGSNGKTPLIAVDPKITNGSPGVSVSATTVSSTPKYTFTFTLPTIPSGYQEMDVCVKKSDGTMYLKTACPNPTTSYYSYTVLVKP